MVTPLRIYDEAIVERRFAPAIMLDGAAIKRPYDVAAQADHGQKQVTSGRIDRGSLTQRPITQADARNPSARRAGFVAADRIGRSEPNRSRRRLRPWRNHLLKRSPLGTPAQRLSRRRGPSMDFAWSTPLLPFGGSDITVSGLPLSPQ